MVKEVLAYSTTANYYGDLKDLYPNLDKACTACKKPYQDSDAVTEPSNLSHIWCQLKGPVLSATRAFKKYVTHRSVYIDNPPTQRETIKYSEKTKYTDEIPPFDCSNCEKPFQAGEAITNHTHVWCQLTNSVFFKKNFEEFVEHQDPSLREMEEKKSIKRASSAPGLTSMDRLPLQSPQASTGVAPSEQIPARVSEPSQQQLNLNSFDPSKPSGILLETVRTQNSDPTRPTLIFILTLIVVLGVTHWQVRS